MHIRRFQVRHPFRVYKYVLGEVLTPFLGGFAFCMFVFLMFQIIKFADYFINRGVGMLMLLKIMIYISSAFLPVVMPISFLVAILVGFGRMSADSEVVAFKAAGFSLRQLYFPVSVFSIVVTLLIYYLTNFFIPWGNYQFKKTTTKLGSTKVVSNLKEGTFTEGFFDLLVYSDKVDPIQNKMRGVFIYDERDLKNPMVILAENGVVTPLKTETDFGSAAILKLNNGSIHRTDLSKKYYEKIDFNEYRLRLEVEEHDTGEITYPKTLQSKELLKKIAALSHDYSKYAEYEIEYWKRISLSLTPLIFGLLGVGLGIVRNRSVKSNTVLTALGVIMSYWGLHILGTNLAEKGLLSPFLSMQLSNIVVVPFAIVSFKRSSW